MLRLVVNRDGVNKLSQLSISVSFTLQITCLRYVPIYVTHHFLQSIGYVSHVLRLA
jgi:hypothetical protein